MTRLRSSPTIPIGKPRTKTLSPSENWRSRIASSVRTSLPLSKKRGVKFEILDCIEVNGRDRDVDIRIRVGVPVRMVVLVSQRERHLDSRTIGLWVQSQVSGF